MRHRLAAPAVALLVALPAWLGADPPPVSPPFPIWPIPREARVADTRLLLTDAVIVVPPGDRRAQWPGRLLAEIVADEFGVVLPVVTGTAPEGRTPIVVGEAAAPEVSAAAARARATVPDAAEGYLLSVDASGAVVAGRDYRGALYGVSSFVQLVHRWGKHSVAVRRAVVRDWPFLPVRWVHLFLPGRDQLDFARRSMRDVLLRYKFNGIVLELGGGHAAREPPRDQRRLEADGRRVVRARRDDRQAGRGHPPRDRQSLRRLAPRRGRRRRLRREGRRAAARGVGRSLRPGDRPRGAGARPHLLHRLRPARPGRGPGDGLARLLLPLEPRVLPRLLRRARRVSRGAAAEARAHRPRRVEGRGLLPALPRQGHGRPLRRGRPRDPPAPPREGDRDVDVGRPLRGRPQPLREAVGGGRGRPLRAAGHHLRP